MFSQEQDKDLKARWQRVKNRGDRLNIAFFMIYALWVKRLRPRLLLLLGLSIPIALMIQWSPVFGALFLVFLILTPNPFK